jgi:hypothetical protein
MEVPVSTCVEELAPLKDFSDSVFAHFEGNGK